MKKPAEHADLVVLTILVLLLSMAYNLAAQVWPGLCAQIYNIVLSGMLPGIILGYFFRQGKPGKI